VTAFYNEIDPYAAQWLRNLIAAGHIAPGIVDERSIEDVRPDELAGYTQCHFFAGIGVWSLALRNAGWADDRPVWTGSCPCQPFSEAGKGLGFADQRHLWPAWQHLISQCRPPILFGEQVSKKNAEPWLDLVHDDLEAVGYAFGALAFPSAGIGAPHIRDRTYWVAHSDSEHGNWSWDFGTRRRIEDSIRRESCGMADADHSERRPGAAGGDQRDRQDAGRQESSGDAQGCGEPGAPGPVNGFWRGADWIGCRDGRWRPIKPGSTALANGSPSRVGRLRAYGNAINAQAAQIFIESVMSTPPQPQGGDTP